MSNVSKIDFGVLKKSKYFIPYKIKFIENGKKKKWHFVHFLDNVAVIIFNSTRNKLVFVKQFRPTVYARNIPRKKWRNSVDVGKYPAELGSSIEFCAGIVDKDRPVEEIAKMEVFEETGYEIEVDKLHMVAVLRSTGTAVYDVHLFFVEVDDSMKITQGGGIDNESIEVVELSLTEVKSIIDDSSGAVHHYAFIFGLMWFFNNKV